MHKGDECPRQGTLYRLYLGIGEADILSTSTPIPAQWTCRRRCRDAYNSYGRGGRCEGCTEATSALGEELDAPDGCERGRADLVPRVEDEPARPCARRGSL